MKRILFVFMLFLLMAGCSSPYRVVTNSVDFSMYTDNGFFISESDAVPFEYNGVSLLFTKIVPGYENGYYKAANYQDATTEIVRTAMLLKADGIVNLKYSIVPINKYEYELHVSGMAIKRKR